MNTRLLSFFFFVSTLIFSVKASGQATCIAVIDGTRTEFCVGSAPVTFSNAAAVGENIEWLSLGDGTFDNRFAVNPTYTPGSRDRSNGYAYILLDVYKDDTVDYCSELPWVKLTLGSMSATANPASQSICTGTSITSIALSGVSGGTYRWTRDNTASVTGIAASGTGNISGTLTNNTGAPLTVTFTITPSTASCTGTPITATVVVSPRPTATASVSSQSICSNSSITPIVLSSNFNDATFTWTRNNTSSVTGIASSGTGNIAGTLRKTSLLSSTTVTFTITPRLSGCAGSTITSTVTVTTSNVAVTGTPASQTVCSGAAITSIVPSGGSGSGAYSWTRNNTTTITGIAASGTGNINGALVNNSNTPGYVTFTISRASNTCTNRATVLVNPAPVATASPLSQTICSAAAITAINMSSNINGTTYNWTRNNTALVTGIAASGSGNISGSLVNSSNSPVTVTFTISPIYNGCAGTAITASVIVAPNPSTIIIAPLSQSVCSGTAIVPISGSGSGITYNWVRDNSTAVTGLPVSGTGSIEGILTTTALLPATVTFTITPESNGCSGQPVTASVIVNARPAASITGSQTVCAGTTAPALNIALTGAAPWSLTYTDGTTPVSVNNINSNSYTFNVPAAANTYTVTALSDANCASQPIDITGSAVLSQLSYGITASSDNGGSITSAGLTNIACGNDQTYFITANQGYTISNVLVDNVSVGAVTFYTFNNVTTAHTISAIFTLNTFSITASAGSDGSISPSGNINIVGGGNQLYTILPGNCYKIADVLVDGISVGAVASYTFNNVTTSHTISARFSSLNYPITASADNNGSISGVGITDVNCGNNQTYTISANSCYQVADVLVDGVSVGAVSSYTFSNVTSAHTISATFTSLSYAVNATAGSNGSITPAGITNIDCGSNKVYTINADAGFNILDVLVDGVSAGAVSSYTFTNVTTSHTISAIFGTSAFTIRASAGNNGSITPSGSSTIVNGGNQTYTITANNCYQVADVLVDGVSVGAVSSYTFANVTAAHTISATFTSLSYVITATAGNNGSITAAGITNVNCGANQTYTITANNCNQVADVLADGVSVGAVSSYTFTNVTAAHTISATFTSLSYAITATAGANGTITNAGTTNVNCGGNQTYNITASAGFSIQSVLIDGVSAGVISSYTFTNVTAPHTISVIFAASAGCTLRGTIAAAAIACNGSATTLTVTALGGTGARQFSLNGGAFQSANTFTVTAEGSPYIVTIRDAVSCVANTNSITVAPAATTVPGIPAGIDGQSTGLCSGGNISYTVLPAPGATGYFWSAPAGFSIVSGQGTVQIVMAVPAGFTGAPGVWASPRNACGSGTGFRLALTSTQTVTAANIAGPSVVSPAQSGVQYSVPNEAGATYNWQVPTGSVITAGQGSSSITVTFGSVSGNVSVAVTNGCGTGTRTNKAVSVVSTTINYTITASAGNNGSITPSGSSTIVNGGNQTYTITANNCYQVADVLVDGVSVGAVSSYTFANVTAAHTISATFTSLSYVITATAGNNGSITAAGITNVNCGANQTYTITANNCNQVADVLADGVSVGAVSSYTFTNVTAAHTISATFTSLSYAITATAGANGTITNAGTTNVNCGGNQTYNITASAGFSIQSVLIDGVSAGVISSYTFTNVTAPHTISVIFAASAGCTLRGTIAAAAIACNGSATTLTVTALGGTGARQFSLNGGAFQSANTFTVTAEGSPYIVTIRDAVSCVANTNSITVAPAATTVPGIPAGIDGQSTGLCSGGNISYTVLPAPGATGYFWSAPAGFSIVSGQGTVQIVMAVPAGFTGAPGVWASPRNACGSGTGFRLALTSTQTVTAANIAGPSVVSPAQSGVQYSVPNEAGATYNWQVPTGSVITAGQGSSSITVTFGSVSGNVSVAVTNGCGTGTRTNKAVSFALTRPAATDIAGKSLSAKTSTATIETSNKLTLSIYPNPAYSNAVITFAHSKAGSKYKVIITNSMGYSVYSAAGLMMGGQNLLQLDLAKFKNGIYIVRLVTEDDAQTIRLVKGQ